MAISNELSSDIATAILSSRQGSSLALEDLKRVVEQVHETLEEMSAEDRRPKARSAAASSGPSEELGLIKQETLNE